jgi:hypothetical protein
MPKFSKEDFTQENATRIMVLIMKRMGRQLLSQFKDLPHSQKVKFNRIMNEYIQSLGEDWEKVMLDEFNLLVNEDILNEEFDPTTTIVKDNRTERQMLISPEQDEWIKKEEAEGRPVLY